MSIFRQWSAVIGALVLVGVASAGVAQAQMARMSLEQMPPIRIVSEGSSQLLALGCQAQTVDTTAAYIMVSPVNPYPVVPAETQTTEVFFCSKEAVSQLEVQGQVLGITDWLSWIGNKAGQAAAWAGSKTIGLISQGISMVIDLLSYAANALLHLAAAGVVRLLAVGSFLDNPVVRAGWPFVLGLANLGFVLALLFIALSTVLRIEGFQARRMLPRLLIAALLINFSLIIGVLIIDASRLVMAATYFSMSGGAALENLPNVLLKNSTIVQQAFNLSDDTSTLGFIASRKFDSSLPMDAAVNSLLTLMLIVLLTIAFVAVLVGLLIRYFALMILLVASPLAYLFVALPGTAHLARRWWTEFIKYVIYGPVVVFILALVAALGQQGGALVDQFGSFFGNIANVVVTAVFLFGAAIAGQQLGTLGGQMVGGLYKKPVRVLGKAAYVGSGARRALRRIGEEATQLGPVKAMRRYAALTDARAKQRQQLRDHDIGQAKKEGAKRARRTRGRDWLGRERQGKEAEAKYKTFEEKIHARDQERYYSVNKATRIANEVNDAKAALRAAAGIKGNLSTAQEAAINSKALDKVHKGEMTQPQADAWAEEVKARLRTNKGGLDNLTRVKLQDQVDSGQISEDTKSLIQRGMRSDRMSQDEVLIGLEGMKDEGGLYEGADGNLTTNIADAKLDAQGDPMKAQDVLASIIQHHGSGKTTRAIIDNQFISSRLSSNKKDAWAARIDRNENIYIDDIREPSAYELMGLSPAQQEEQKLRSREQFLNEAEENWQFTVDKYRKWARGGGGKESHDD